MKQILHIIKRITLPLLCTLLLGTLCACRTDPCPVCGATYVCDCATVETVSTDQPVTPPMNDLGGPPALEVLCGKECIRLSSGNYEWTVDNGDGTMRCTNACGVRPCDWDETPTIELAAIGDSDYLLQLRCDGGYQRVTVTAYPVGEYEDRHATDCPVENGTLGVLKGDFYYELTVHFAQGSATYGFFVQ